MNVLLLVVAVSSTSLFQLKPIAASAERIARTTAVPLADKSFRVTDVSQLPRRRKQESFFSATNLALGAGLAVSAWWDVKTSYDCFNTAPVVTRTPVPNGVVVTTTSCYETNSRMAQRFAQGPGAVYREKAWRNGALWVGGWGLRWVGRKIHSWPVEAIGYAGPAGGIGLQVRWSVSNIKTRHQLERLRQ